MSWIEDFQGMALPLSNFAWTDRDLFTLYGVTKGAVVLIALINDEATSDNLLGVRTKGSALTRYINVQEAEDGGQSVVTMFSQTDANGVIQIYTSDINNTGFALLGWLEGCTYTELDRNTYLNPIADGTWRAIGAGAYADRVCDIMLGNFHSTSEWFVGVRETESILGRRFDIMENEGAITSLIGNILVQADGAGNFEGFREDASTSITIWGYFSANVTYTEAMIDEAVATDVTWGNETISAPANSIAQYVITNSKTTDELWGGIRENGSAINRRFNLREAEGLGVTGLGDLVNVDGAQVIENYIEDGAFVDLWYVGYLTIEAPVATSMVGGPTGWIWDDVVSGVSIVRRTSDGGLSWSWVTAIGVITIPYGGPTDWWWQEFGFY